MPEQGDNIAVIFNNQGKRLFHNLSLTCMTQIGRERVQLMEALDRFASLSPICPGGRGVVTQP